jgi:hypothetical protein
MIAVFPDFSISCVKLWQQLECLFPEKRKSLRMNPKEDLPVVAEKCEILWKPWACLTQLLLA